MHYSSGRHDKCEAAKLALMALVPITIEVPVPYDLHRFIIGQKGKDVREMMTTFDVNIKSKSHTFRFYYQGFTSELILFICLVPSAEQQSDAIQISGPVSKVEAARQALLDRVVELEKEREDRVLRSFAVTVGNLYLIYGNSGINVLQFSFARLKYRLNITRRS